MAKSKPEDNLPVPNMEEKILSAAEELFFRQGYSQTSTTQIAKAAGCNQALIHYYFRTKDKLFNAVLGGKVKEVFRKFLSLEAGSGSFREKLTSLISIHYDTLRENSGMVLFLMTELTHNPALFTDLLSEIGEVPAETFRVFKKDLEEEIDCGRIRPISMMDLILNVISLNVFLFAVKPLFGLAWGLDRKEMEKVLDERKKEITDTVLLSLRP